MVGAGVGTATESIKAYRGQARDLPTPGEMYVEIETELIELHLAKSSKAAASSPTVTRAQFFIMQEMARDDISSALAAARLRGLQYWQAEQLVQRRPDLQCGFFPYAAAIHAQAIVRQWWNSPY